MYLNKYRKCVEDQQLKTGENLIQKLSLSLSIAQVLFPKDFEAINFILKYLACLWVKGGGKGGM